MIGIAGFTLFLWSCSTAAALVSYDFNFSGIDLSDPPDGVTATVTFRLSYDSAAIDSNPAADVGAYAGNVIFISGGVSSVQVPVTIDVIDGTNGSFDLFGFSIVKFPAPPYPFVDGLQIDSAGFSLLADDGAMLSNDLLPTSTEFVSQANHAIVVLGVLGEETPQGQDLPQGSFTAVNSPVPEPATYLLMVIGLAGLLVALGKRCASWRV